ncbi:hypothetical protein, partial [Nocardia carnea]|uniref:hypothetical protein n=1 Tax=Nocardia carnea TaxID=37328 RepID=UPI002455622F
MVPSLRGRAGSHNPGTEGDHGGAESYEAPSGSPNPGTGRDHSGAESYEALGGFGPSLLSALDATRRSRDQELVGAKTGLRAACLSGVATGKLAETGRAAGDITLAAGG